MRPPGLREYVVVHGRATIEEGGAPELLQQLGHRPPRPGCQVPAPMDDPSPGHLSGSRSSAWAGSAPGPTDGQASGIEAPRSDSGRGPKMRRSDSSIATSLMLASRRRMYPSSSNSHCSFP